MNDMREIVDPAEVGRFLAILSAVCIPGSLLLWGMARRGRAGLRRAAFWTATGVLLWPLWTVYNRIEDSLGLDSVLALFINLGLFILVGWGLGECARRLRLYEEGSAPTGPQED